MTERAELIDRGEVAPSWGWWLLLLIGIVSVVAGGILVAKPSHSLATLSVIFGIFLLIDGIVDVASSFGRGEENRALTAIFGLLAIVIGILLIRHPTTAVSAIGLIIGIWLVAAGALRLLRAFTFGGHVVLRVLIAAARDRRRRDRRLRSPHRLRHAGHPARDLADHQWTGLDRARNRRPSRALAR